MTASSSEIPGTSPRSSLATSGEGGPPRRPLLDNRLHNPSGRCLSERIINHGFIASLYAMTDGVLRMEVKKSRERSHKHLVLFALLTLFAGLGMTAKKRGALHRWQILDPTYSSYSPTT